MRPTDKLIVAKWQALAVKALLTSPQPQVGLTKAYMNLAPLFEVIWTTFSKCVACLKKKNKTADRA